VVATPKRGKSGRFRPSDSFSLGAKILVATKAVTNDVAAGGSCED
jgi:hypothetical protein